MQVSDNSIHFADVSGTDLNAVSAQADPIVASLGKALLAIIGVPVDSFLGLSLVPPSASKDELLMILSMSGMTPAQFDGVIFSIPLTHEPPVYMQPSSLVSALPMDDDEMPELVFPTVNETQEVIWFDIEG